MIMDIDIKHLAKLARLSLTDEEEKMMAEQLPQILEYVGKLQEVDTTSVDAKAYLTDAVNVMRADNVVTTDAAHRRALIDAFPEKAADAMRVPGVFE